MANPFMQNPQMYEQFMKNITPEQINFAKQTMSQMSDEQLKNIGKMGGMGDIDPNLLRSASGQYPAYHQYQNQNYQQTKQENQNQPFQKIVDIKEEGNNYFRKQDYEQASQKYFEAILEIEEKKSQKINSPDLIKLEISCRMNYAAAKSKLNDFEVVLIQAREVLKIEDNPKAFFREGQALFQMGLIKKSLQSLEKAHQMLPNDQTVANLYEEAKQKINQEEEKEEYKKENTNQKEIQEKQQESAKENQKKKLKEKKLDKNIGNFQNDPILQKSQQAEQFFDEEFIKQQKEQEKNSAEQGQQQQKQQQKQQQQKQKQETKIQQEEQKKEIHQDVIIEQEEVKKEQNNIKPQQQQQQVPQPTLNQQYSQPQMSQYLDQFKNMSDGQLGQMCNMIQSMDSNTLKNLYKSQGMDLSDQQIQMMKSMYKPETIKMVAQMQGANQNSTQSQQQQQQQQQVQQQTTTEHQMQDPSESMPSPQMFQNMMGKDQMSNLANNPEMISTAMNMLKSNPDMIKSMASMFGDNNPLSKYLQNANSNDLKRMVGLLSYLAGCCQGIMKAYRFIKNNKLAIGILIGSIIVYKYRLFG